MNYFSFTRVSGNAKTGPIPVTMTSRNSCPDSCALKANGCYADSGMVRLHWSKLDHKGLTLDQLLGNIKALPKGQLWRHNVAGDLPSDTNGIIDNETLMSFVHANIGKRGFTYTHNQVLGKSIVSTANKGLIQYANAQGFTVNLSANSAEHADTLLALAVGPVVCLMPEDAPKLSTTPAGNTVVLCPATYQDNVTCAACGICAVSTRKAIIGFPVHGTSKRKANKVITLHSHKGE